MFKILNGYENIDYNIFFEIKEGKITRGHNYTLVKKQSRLDVRKYSFSQRTINVWNNLSTDCVQASSVNTGLDIGLVGPVARGPVYLKTYWPTKKTYWPGGPVDLKTYWPPKKLTGPPKKRTGPYLKKTCATKNYLHKPTICTQAYN